MKMTTPGNSIAQFDLFEHYDEMNFSGLEERQKFADFCREVTVLADKEIGVPFKSEGREKAAIIMAKLFQTARKSIKIFAGNLNGDISGISIWNEAIIMAFDCIPDLTIDVILQNDPPSESKGFKTILNLQQKFRERVTLEKLNEGKGLEKEIHFTVVDDNKYRLETDIKTYQSVSSFDDKDGAAKLLNLFALLKTQTKTFEV